MGKRKMLKTKTMHDHYKVIALRFLKEVGLYKAWMRYIEYSYSKHLTADNWYKKDCIDEIFGQTCFSDYLHKKYGYKFSGYISSKFRDYIRTFYPNLVMSGHWYDDEMIIDKKTHNIKL